MCWEAIGAFEQDLVYALKRSVWLPREASVVVEAGEAAGRLAGRQRSSLARDYVAWTKVSVGRSDGGGSDWGHILQVGVS